MAQYNGYVEVPHDSYDAWRSATLGNGYDVDYAYGDQCWDFCALLYWQYGLMLKTGDGTAAGCWSIMRNANAIDPFIAVTGIQNIKRGDIVVLDITPVSFGGHIAFADEDYDGSGRINLLGQNQMGTGTGAPANVVSFGLSNFLGIFRNTNWDSSPEPVEETTVKKRKYPWAVAINHWYNGKR